MGWNLVVGLALFSMAGVAGAAPGMEELLKPCVGCHGMDGAPAAAKTPSLSGQVPQYMVFTMTQYQIGYRPSAVPKHVPANLTRDELTRIAEHYGKSSTPRPVQTTDAAKLARGLPIYEKRCRDCHPDGGRITDTRGHNSPILASLPAQYLYAQTLMYVDGERRYLAERDKAHRGLEDSDLEAVSHYFASQVGSATRK